MVRVNNMSDLLSQLDRVAKKSLADSHGIAKETMKKNVKEVVYNTYEPSDYKRTHQLEEDISVDILSNGKMLIRSDRMERFGSNANQVRRIYKTIETGRGYVWGRGQLDSRIGPRPFISQTKKDLESGLMKEAMIRNLEGKGYKIK